MSKPTRVTMSYLHLRAAQPFQHPSCDLLWVYFQHLQYRWHISRLLVYWRVRPGRLLSPARERHMGHKQLELSQGCCKVLLPSLWIKPVKAMRLQELTQNGGSFSLPIKGVQTMRPGQKYPAMQKNHLFKISWRISCSAVEESDSGTSTYSRGRLEALFPLSSGVGRISYLNLTEWAHLFTYSLSINKGITGCWSQSA